MTGRSQMTVDFRKNFSMRRGGRSAALRTGKSGGAANKLLLLLSAVDVRECARDDAFQKPDCSTIAALRKLGEY
jgi:hypothetical protein